MWRGRLEVVSNLGTASTLNMCDAITNIPNFFASVQLVEMTEVDIAHLAHSLLGEPEENLHKFKELFQFGVSSQPGQENQTSDIKLRTLALLSATAVMIDIFPSLIMVADDMETTHENKTKASKEHHAQNKRSQEILSLFDQLLEKMNKIKLVGGVCALLNSAVCSPNCLSAKRLQQLVTSAVWLSCLSKEGIQALRQRVRSDLANNTDNLEVVKLIVLCVTKEKNPQRLNVLMPLFENIRFSSAAVVVDSSLGGPKVDRQLAKDLATGRGDYVDMRKLKSTEAHILSELMALFIRVTRAAQSGQYSFRTVKTCIEGISTNAGSVNSDLAVELEEELLLLARFYLVTRRGDNPEDGVLGAIALTALLSISKGTQLRNEVLVGSVLSGIEQLVPLALDRLLSASTEGCEGTLTALCRGAIAVAAQFGSDKCLLAVARALINSLCLRCDDTSKLVVELLIHVAARSPLVRTAIDPDGVLVDGGDPERPLDRAEISLFWQLSGLIGHLGCSDALSNSLLGNLSKYCRELASRDRADAVAKEAEERDVNLADRKRRKMNRHK